jgi:hypothetical protein
MLTCLLFSLSSSAVAMPAHITGDVLAVEDEGVGFLRIGGQVEVAAGAYENPYKGPCGAGEKNLTLTGLPGAICGPACSPTVPCAPAPAGSTAKPQCAVDIAPSKTPNACALVCKPPGVGGCPTGATCKPIQNVGICTYNSGPAPPPAPPGPPAPPSPPGSHYGDPNAGPCSGGDVAVTVTGLAGKVCAPACSTSSPCPPPPAGCTAKGQCVLEAKGSKTPNACVLICKSDDPVKQMTILQDLTCPVRLAAALVSSVHPARTPARPVGFHWGAHRVNREKCQCVMPHRLLSQNGLSRMNSDILMIHCDTRPVYTSSTVDHACHIHM